MPMMPTHPTGPDLEVSLHLDAYAPRAARYHVARVDRPSPDLRDAVGLLTSEMVTRAVLQRPSDLDEIVLRVWMPHDLVRVELRTPREFLGPPLDDREGPNYDLLLFAEVADRWSIDTCEGPAFMWFEIDRHPSEVEPRRETHAGTDASPPRRSLLRRRRRVADAPARRA